MANQKMRQEFEAWYGPAATHRAPHGHFARFNESDKYIMDMVQVAWLAWQEAARQAMETAAKAVREGLMMEPLTAEKIIRALIPPPTTSGNGEGGGNG